MYILSKLKLKNWLNKYFFVMLQYFDYWIVMQNIVLISAGTVEARKSEVAL